MHTDITTVNDLSTVAGHYAISVWQGRGSGCMNAALSAADAADAGHIALSLGFLSLDEGDKLPTLALDSLTGATLKRVARCVREVSEHPERDPRTWGSNTPCTVDLDDAPVRASQNDALGDAILDLDAQRFLDSLPEYVRDFLSSERGESEQPEYLAQVSRRQAQRWSKALRTEVLAALVAAGLLDSARASRHVSKRTVAPDDSWRPAPAVRLTVEQWERVERATEADLLGR